MLKFTPNRAVEQLALSVARLCGLDIAGVDLLLTGDKEKRVEELTADDFRVCEVNSAPGFEVAAIDCMRVADVRAFAAGSGARDGRQRASRRAAVRARFARREMRLRRVIEKLQRFSFLNNRDTGTPAVANRSESKQSRERTPSCRSNTRKCTE